MSRSKHLDDRGRVEKKPEKKTSSSYKLEANFMFSFVSIAKPGKHFLIETDEEDGQPENGPVPNDYAGELLSYRTCCVLFPSDATTVK